MVVCGIHASSMLSQLMEMEDGLDDLSLRVAVADALRCRSRGERLLWDNAEMVESWLRLSMRYSGDKLEFTVVVDKLPGFLEELAELLTLRMEL